MQNGFLKKIIASTDNVVSLYQFKASSGKEIYCFIRSNKVSFERLKLKLKAGHTVKLMEYGALIDFGENQPSQGLIDTIKAQYSA